MFVCKVCKGEDEDDNVTTTEHELGVCESCIHDHEDPLGYAIKLALERCFPGQDSNAAVAKLVEEAVWLAGNWTRCVIAPPPPPCLHEHGTRGGICEDCGSEV